MNDRDKQDRGFLKLIIVGIILVGAISIWAGFHFSADDSEKTATTGNGNGAKAVTIEVVDDNGDTTSYEINTDEEKLRGVLDELAENQKFTFSGDESEYGLFVTEVNGVKADYDTDETYWSWYLNGEICNYGIDSQPVADGDKFEAKFEHYTDGQ